WCFRPSFAYDQDVPSRRCRVCFTDMAGITHVANVTGESLYEAAAAALAEFKKMRVQRCHRGTCDTAARCCAISIYRAPDRRQQGTPVAQQQRQEPGPADAEGAAAGDARRVIVLLVPAVNREGEGKSDRLWPVTANEFCGSDLLWSSSFQHGRETALPSPIHPRANRSPMGQIAANRNPG